MGYSGISWDNMEVNGKWPENHGDEVIALNKINANFSYFFRIS